MSASNATLLTHSLTHWPDVLPTNSVCQSSEESAQTLCTACVTTSLHNSEPGSLLLLLLLRRRRRQRTTTTTTTTTTLSLSPRFNGHLWPFTRRTWLSQYQNISILDFIEAKDDGGKEKY